MHAKRVCNIVFQFSFLSSRVKPDFDFWCCISSRKHVCTCVLRRKWTHNSPLFVVGNSAEWGSDTERAHTPVVGETLRLRHYTISNPRKNIRVELITLHRTWDGRPRHFPSYKDKETIIDRQPEKKWYFVFVVPHWIFRGWIYNKHFCRDLKMIKWHPQKTASSTYKNHPHIFFRLGFLPHATSHRYTGGQHCGGWNPKEESPIERIIFVQLNSFSINTNER